MRGHNVCFNEKKIEKLSTNYPFYPFVSAALLLSETTDISKLMF